MPLCILSLEFPDGAILTAYLDIDIDNQLIISGKLVDMADGVIVHFNLFYWQSSLGTVIGGDLFVEIENLGEAELYIRVTTSETIGATYCDISADFEPSDLIEWLCIGEQDTALRDELIAMLPELEELFKGFAAFDGGLDFPEDFPGEDVFGDGGLGVHADDPFVWGLDEDTEDVSDEVTALVHIPGFGRSGWIDHIRPRGYLDVHQIVAEALAL